MKGKTNDLSLDPRAFEVFCDDKILAFSLNNFLSVPSAVKALGVTAPTVRSAVKNLEKLRILREITGKQRDRVYVYDPYMKILEKGTELNL